MKPGISNKRAVEMFSVPEVAELFSVKEATVRAWILRRNINYCKIGRLVRISSDEVQRILSSGAVPARNHEV